MHKPENGTSNNAFCCLPSESGEDFIVQQWWVDGQCQRQDFVSSVFVCLRLSQFFLSLGSALNVYVYQYNPQA